MVVGAAAASERQIRYVPEYRAMRFKCHCGNIVRDTSDRLRNKAHLIPDQCWHELQRRLETSVLGALASGTISLADAEWQMMELLLNATRTAYQCTDCGRLFLSVGEGKLECYSPESGDTSKHVLGEQPGGA